MLHQGTPFVELALVALRIVTLAIIVLLLNVRQLVLQSGFQSKGVEFERVDLKFMRLTRLSPIGFNILFLR